MLRATWPPVSPRSRPAASTDDGVVAHRLSCCFVLHCGRPSRVGRSTRRRSPRCRGNTFAGAWPGRIVPDERSVPAGVARKPGWFCIGVKNGGVWRSTDYWRVWIPIVVDQPTGSISVFAVASSNPDVLWVGSGDGLQRPDLSTATACIDRCTSRGARGCVIATCRGNVCFRSGWSRKCQWMDTHCCPPTGWLW